jgi:hypothetical protein
MLKFYQLWLGAEGSLKNAKIDERPPKSKANQIVQTPSAQSLSTQVPFPLPWSHYVRLLSVEKPETRHFYEEEAIPWLVPLSFSKKVRRVWVARTV